MADSSGRGWLKLPKAARYCDVHPVTLRRAAQAGECAGVQSEKNKHWSFLPVDLDRWVRGDAPRPREELVSA